MLSGNRCGKIIKGLVKNQDNDNELMEKMVKDKGIWGENENIGREMEIDIDTIKIITIKRLKGYGQKLWQKETTEKNIYFLWWFSPKAKADYLCNYMCLAIEKLHLNTVNKSCFSIHNEFWMDRYNYMTNILY